MIKVFIYTCENVMMKPIIMLNSYKFIKTFKRKIFPLFKYYFKLYS